MLFRKIRNGKEYGGYKIKGLLGQGRYGECYLAINPWDQHVVIKRFKPGIFKKNQKNNHYEAVILSQIDHFAIPKFLGVINQEEFYAFVLEFKPGKTVEYLLFEEKHSFDRMEVFNMGYQLIQIIKYLHTNRIVHRDLSISNVLVEQGRVSLVDFGLSRWVNHQDYRYDQDFSYLGDFLLYLLYSSKEKKTKKNNPWYIELDLPGLQQQFLKRMLHLEKPYASISDVEFDFNLAFI